MTTLVAASAGSAAMARVAVSPSTPGMRMSMSTMSGRWARARSMAAAPSSAWPTTSMSGWVARIIASPERTRVWSSAMIDADGHTQRDAGGHREAAGGERAGVEGSAIGGDPLSHADEAVPSVAASSAGWPSRRVVADVELQLPGRASYADTGGDRASVVEHVGERFLDDPVGGHGDPGRAGGHVARWW